MRTEMKKTREKMLVFEKIRQDFVANVSHELRTPLTVIRGYLELLVEAQTVDQNFWRSKFQQMFEQSLRMEQLIDDLLLLSKLESNALPSSQKKDLNVSSLLMTIIDEAKELGSDKSHEITHNINPDLNLLGAHDELYSAFSNLIFNAVNYTPNDGKIHIDWNYEYDKPCFKVTDEGIGIDKKHINRLTERFYRVDKARQRAHGGTGLGLAIVKHVLLRHEANLEISSQLGQGSTFKCVFKQ